MEKKSSMILKKLNPPKFYSNYDIQKNWMLKMFFEGIKKIEFLRNEFKNESIWKKRFLENWIS